MQAVFPILSRHGSFHASWSRFRGACPTDLILPASPLLSLRAPNPERVRARDSGEVIADFPPLKSLHEHVMTLPEIRDFVRGPNWMPFPADIVGQEYVKNVRKVLTRD